VIWHSDKPLYQKACMQKIASIMGVLGSEERKMEWFENFLYIFNKHWDKIDNFRIDKFLMFLRFMFNQSLAMLRDSKYQKEYVKWYQKTVFSLYKGQLNNESASGVTLQICDIFVQELNLVDSDISLETLAELLHPFL
jgi:hypothetical protein